MSGQVKFWLEQLYDEAIEDVKSTISNEHLWELGYDGKRPNPHTENIRDLNEYIEVLKALKEELINNE